MHRGTKRLDGRGFAAVGEVLVVCPSRQRSVAASTVQNIDAVRPFSFRDLAMVNNLPPFFVVAIPL